MLFYVNAISMCGMDFPLSEKGCNILFTSKHHNFTDCNAVEVYNVERYNSVRLYFNDELQVFNNHRQIPSRSIKLKHLSTVNGYSSKNKYPVIRSIIGEATLTHIHHQLKK